MEKSAIKYIAGIIESQLIVCPHRNYLEFDIAYNNDDDEEEAAGDLPLYTDNASTTSLMQLGGPPLKLLAAEAAAAAAATTATSERDADKNAVVVGRSANGSGGGAGSGDGDLHIFYEEHEIEARAQQCIRLPAELGDANEFSVSAI